MTLKELKKHLAETFNTEYEDYEVVICVNYESVSIDSIIGVQDEKIIEIGG